MTSLLVTWLVSAVSLLVVAYLVPGFSVSGIVAALIAAVAIGLVNGTLGAFLKLVTFPLSVITLGLFWLVINALMLMAAAAIVPGFRVDGFGSAFVGGILLSIVNTVFGWVVKPAIKKSKAAGA
jgi:putative membrane protein